MTSHDGPTACPIRPPARRRPAGRRSPRTRHGPLPRALLLAGLALGPLVAGAVDRTAGPIGRTAAMPGTDDVADDVTVWVDPVDSERSVIIGTNKSDAESGDGGLYAFTATGGRWGGGAWEEGVNRFDDERYNTVDLRYGVRIGRSRWDLVAASNRSDREIDVFRVETASDGRFAGLSKVGEIALGPGLAPDTDAPYGLAMLQRPDGTASVLISDKDGLVAQYRLRAGDAEPVTATRVGLWDISRETGPVEGMVADDERGVVYIASENRSIDRFGTDADGVLDTASVQRVDDVVEASNDKGRKRLQADIEGLALYRARDGAGYLIASSQGSDAFVVYDRRFTPGAANARLLAFDLEGVENTDGIEVVNAPLGERLPFGAFIAHDGLGSSPTRYAIVSWSAIARGDLIVDVAADPRD